MLLVRGRCPGGRYRGVQRDVMVASVGEVVADSERSGTGEVACRAQFGRRVAREGDRLYWVRDRSHPSAVRHRPTRHQR